MKELCNAYCAEEEGQILTEAANEDPNKYFIVIGGKEQQVNDVKTFTKTILSRVTGDKKAAQAQLDTLLKEGGEAGFTIRNGTKLQSITAKVELGLAAASRKEQRAVAKANKKATQLDGKYKFKAYLENGVVKIFCGTKELVQLPDGATAQQAIAPLVADIEKIIKDETAE